MLGKSIKEVICCSSRDLGYVPGVFFSFFGGGGWGSCFDAALVAIFRVLVVFVSFTESVSI